MTIEHLTLAQAVGEAPIFLTAFVAGIDSDPVTQTSSRSSHASDAHEAEVANHHAA
ncbi:MAG: hypothetical protein WAW17_02480 [Rhodococcus sp. (in: high G+C Gram-positive bacteria)]|uniref:hypothetical protein n=1 Tax=Rhodococcus sp. TaxID=1831 RepID=UPI003BB1EC71